MQDHQIIILSKIFAGYIRALGMQAENSIRESEGKSLAYDMEAFDIIASNIECEAEQLR